MTAARAGQQVIILNPTTPVGSNDIKPTPTGRIIVDFLNRKFPAYVDTGLNLVDVDEVAQHARGCTGARAIRRAVHSGWRKPDLKQILDKMSAITGLPSPTMEVPHGVAMAFAFFDETFTGRLRGQGTARYGGGGADGKKKMFASSAKAERELGFRMCAGLSGATGGD